jgi:hypothetical protein
MKNSYTHKVILSAGDTAGKAAAPTARQDNRKNLMKACHYLQVSSAIIGKHRHLSYPGVFLCDHGHFCALSADSSKP